MDAVNYYPIEEVANKLGVSDRVVRRLIQDGELEANQFGKEYRISDSQIQQYIERTSTLHCVNESDQALTSDTQIELSKIAAATELALKEKERIEAVNTLEATKLHYPDAATWRKAQSDFMASVEDSNQKLEAEKKKLAQLVTLVQQREKGIEIRIQEAVRIEDNQRKCLSAALEHEKNIEKLLGYSISRLRPIAALCNDVVRSGDRILEYLKRHDEYKAQELFHHINKERRYILDHLDKLEQFIRICENIK